MDLYHLALGIAKRAHMEQLDKAGKEYINHPIFISKQFDTETEKAVALLHDVVEDSDITFSDLLNKGIPKEVVEAVSLLTKEEGQSYQEYLERVKANGLATKVKLADLKHNSDLSRISNPSEKDIRRLEKYLKAIKFLNN